METEVLTYFLTRRDIELIKISIQAHIHQCENILKSLSDEDERIKVENKIRELNDLLIGM